MHTWKRYASDGYEVSSRGDARFSALKARLKDGRTVEEAYQLDVKGYRRLGWTVGQAKRDRGRNAPVRLTPWELWLNYLNLWRQWATENPSLMGELRTLSEGKPLTDMFASSDVSQARALAQILNETTQP
jgi:hypothetical protein